MEVFLVGGMVRDTVLGRADKSSDCDYVVVGSSPQEMLKRGFTQVGASFPVFLDANGDEYALARTERKTGVGYHGFEVAYDSSVTLEDDLLRRDLTINSMAMRLDTKEIIDPYGGKQDLADRVIRHTSEAFAEDPVRVLRAARFAARFNFTIHTDTLALMERVAPELIHVPHERIVKEFQKSIDDAAFSKMCYWLTVVNVHKLAPLTNYCIEDVEALGDKQHRDVYWTVLLRDVVISGAAPSYISSSQLKHASLCYKFYDLLSEYSALSPLEKLSVHLTLKTKKSLDQVEAIASTTLSIFGTSADMINIRADADVLRNIDMAKAFSQRPPHIPPDEWMTNVQTSALARG